MWLNPRKTKITIAGTYALSYGDLTLGGEEFEEVKSLHILKVTFDSKITFETHLREVVSKATRSLDVVRWAGKLFDCSRVLNSCVNAYVFPKLSYSLPCRWRLRSFI